MVASESYDLESGISELIHKKFWENISDFFKFKAGKLASQDTLFYSQKGTERHNY